VNFARKDRIFLSLAAFSGCIAVVMASIGAHAVESAAAKAYIEKASHYQIVHSLALIASIVLLQQARLASFLFLIGIVLFSGSLYMLAFFPEHFPGTIAAFGGSSLILGWLVLGISLLRIRHPEK